MSIKKTFFTVIISIGLGVLSVLGIFFIRRGRIDRPGVSDSDGLSDRIATGEQVIGEGIDRSKSGVEGSVKRLDGAINRTRSIDDKLTTAIGILRAAKEKNKTNLGG